MEEADFKIYTVWGSWEAIAALLLFLLVALLAAYLTTAYRAGPHLKRGQVVVLTALMLWFSFVLITMLHSSMQIMIDMREQAYFGYTTLRRATAFKWILTVGCSLAPLASINFMIHMRRPTRRFDDSRNPQRARRATDQPPNNQGR